METSRQVMDHVADTARSDGPVRCRRRLDQDAASALQRNPSQLDQGTSSSLTALANPSFVE
ncbi:hypothetical protein AB0E10_40085 [Streptomyces sp. NPDC048045]|uniref:hypothetical protein n=1 Tax=Streptomyces sp. NPDC048045 TaxID=3154710 RepID=UPI003435782E